MSNDVKKPTNSASEETVVGYLIKRFPEWTVQLKNLFHAYEMPFQHFCKKEAEYRLDELGIGFVRKRKYLCNKKRRTLLKKTKDLINEIVAMGFAKEEALKQIDASLDELLGFEKRKELIDEEISEEIYENILFGFQC